MNNPAIHFFDAANPVNVATGMYAGVYVNGFTWPDAQVQRMAKVFRISVRREAFWAEHARCIDVETDAALPSDVPAFIERRGQFLRSRGFAHNDATVYVNRGNWADVRAAVSEAGLPSPLYWVATLDGTTDVAGAWAVQYQMVHGHDVSILHGVDNFHRP